MTKVLYQADQEILGKHLESGEWIMYAGELIIYDYSINPVILTLQSDIYDMDINRRFPTHKEFKGRSIADVFGKLSKWYYINGVVLQN